MPIPWRRPSGWVISALGHVPWHLRCRMPESFHQFQHCANKDFYSLMNPPMTNIELFRAIAAHLGPDAYEPPLLTCKVGHTQTSTQEILEWCSECWANLLTIYPVHSNQELFVLEASPNFPDQHIAVRTDIPKDFSDLTILFSFLDPWCKIHEMFYEIADGTSMKPSARLTPWYLAEYLTDVDFQTGETKALALCQDWLFWLERIQ